MMEPHHPRLSIVPRCRHFSISRSGLYHKPAPEVAEKAAANLGLMRLLNEQFIATPWYGSRQMVRHLRRAGHAVGRKRVRRLMAKIGLTPIDQKPRTSVPHPEYRKYKYLLQNMAITRPSHVWCSDITYIPMRRGFLFLAAVPPGSCQAPMIAELIFRNRMAEARGRGEVIISVALCDWHSADRGRPFGQSHPR